MVERHSAVVRIALLHQHMTVEATHFVDGEHADAAERAGRDGQHFALRDVGAHHAVRIALQAVERDGAGRDVAFQRAAGEVRIAAGGLQQAVLNQLVLDSAVVAHLAGRRVAAVEAHEGVRQLVIELALDVLVVDVLRDGVVDVQQGDSIAGHARADVFAQCAVDVHFAGNRDAAGGQTGVDVAGFKAELGRERRPALVRKDNVLARALVSLCPVQQRQLELRHALAQLRIILALAHFLRHVFADSGDAGVASMFLVGDEQIQLGVLFDFHAQLIQTLNRGIAGEEVLRTRAEGDDLEVLHADDGAGNRDKFRDLVRQLIRRADGIFRDVALQVAHTQIVGAVQHTAVSVAAAVNHVAVAFRRCHKHARAVEILCNQRFGGFRAEVAEEHDRRVALVRLQLLNRLEHVLLVLHRRLDFDDVELLLAALFRNRGTALFAQRNREAVAGNRNQTQLHNGNILHQKSLLLMTLIQGVPTRSIPRSP